MVAVGGPAEGTTPAPVRTGGANSKSPTLDPADTLKVLEARPQKNEGVRHTDMEQDLRASAEVHRKALQAEYADGQGRAAADVAAQRVRVQRLEETIAMKDRQLAEQNVRIAEKDAEIAEKGAEIADLKAMCEGLELEQLQEKGPKAQAQNALQWTEGPSKGRHREDTPPPVGLAPFRVCVIVGCA